MTATHPDGLTTILQDGDAIYLVGQGASPGGLAAVPRQAGPEDRPEDPAVPVRRARLRDAARIRRRLARPHRDRTRVEGRAAQLLHVDLSSGKRTRLTDYRDPAPRLSAAKKELITYRRADGVPLSGTLYLPADYKEGTRLPLIVWAYPLEYSDPGRPGRSARRPRCSRALSALPSCSSSSRATRCWTMRRCRSSAIPRR